MTGLNDTSNLRFRLRRVRETPLSFEHFTIQYRPRWWPFWRTWRNSEGQAFRFSDGEDAALEVTGRLVNTGIPVPQVSYFNVKGERL
jgi:hypothetical protein